MAGSGQRASGGSSGGQRIDDHSFWAGGRSEASILPMGAKTRTQMDGDGAGDLPKYEDTSASIKSTQDEAKRKIKAHQGRLPEYRH